MTAQHVDAWAQLADALLTMGFSAILWFLYHLVTLLVPMRHKVAAFAVHLLFFAGAGLFAFCFVVGQTSLGVVRWYLVAGFGAGAAAYRFCFAPAVERFSRAVRRLFAALLRPLRRGWDRAVRRPLGAARARLQKRREVRYNQHIQRKQARRKADTKEEKRNGDPERGQKKPIQAYTQT